MLRRSRRFKRRARFTCGYRLLMLLSVPSGSLTSSVSLTACTVVALGCLVNASTWRTNKILLQNPELDSEPSVCSSEEKTRHAYDANEVSSAVFPNELLLAVRLTDDRSQTSVQDDVGAVRLVVLSAVKQPPSLQTMRNMQMRFEMFSLVKH